MYAVLLHRAPEGMTRDEAVEVIKSAPSSKSGGKGKGVAKGKARLRTKDQEAA